MLSPRDSSIVQFVARHNAACSLSSVLVQMHARSVKEHPDCDMSVTRQPNCCRIISSALYRVILMHWLTAHFGRASTICCKAASLAELVAFCDNAGMMP